MITSLILMKRWEKWRITMENKEINVTLLREMYNKIRAAEIMNIKTQKHDDKQMVGKIERYIYNTVTEKEEK